MSYRCFTLDMADAFGHLRFSRRETFTSFIPEFWRASPEAINDILENTPPGNVEIAPV